MRIFIIDRKDNSMDCHIFSSKMEARNHIINNRADDESYGIDYFEITHLSKSEYFTFRQTQLVEVSCDSNFDEDISEILEEISEWRKPESTGVKRDGNTALIKASIRILKSSKLTDYEFKSLARLLNNNLARQDSSQYKGDLLDQFEKLANLN